MRKITLILSLLVAMVTTAVGQSVYEQKVPHALYTVTALSEAGVSGNEGGVAFLQDNDPVTFYHSNWSSSYDDGTANKKKGEDGIQAFMVELPETVESITKITYAGRSDGSTNGWAKKVRIYTYTTPPEGLSTNLSSLTYTQKQELLGKESTVLGEPAFNNNEEGVWATDLNVKTAQFAAAQNAKYILFVMDESSNGWLTCSDFNIYYNMPLNEGVTISEVVEDKPYYLKITNINNAAETYYVDITTPWSGTSGPTIGRSTTPVATYFKLVKGSWHIHAMPKSEIAFDNTFLGISNWCATPNTAAPANYSIEYNADGSICLLQNAYYGNSEKARCYLGGDAIIGGKDEIYTDNYKTNAIKIELIPSFTDVEAAKYKANLILARTGAGYPAAESEARTTLQAAIDADGATVESIEAAVTTYKAVKAGVAPEAGKVYRIVSACSGFADNFVRKAVYSDATAINWMTYDAGAMNQMWVVQECNAESKTISIMNLNDAMYPQASDWQEAVKSLNAYNECLYDISALGQFRIKANKLQGFHANLHGNGTGESGNIINYDTEANGASAWYLQEVAVTKEMLGKLIHNVEVSYAYFALIEESDSKTALQTAVSNATEVYNTENGDYAAAFATLSTALTSVKDMSYVDEAYLYLKSKNGNQYMYSNDDNKLATSTEKTIKSIIKLTKANNGTYYIQTGNGLYSQGVNESQQVSLGASPVEYTVRSLDAGYYVLRPTASTNYRQFMHQAGHSVVVGWDTDGANTHWSIELLTEEELAKIYEVELNAIPGVAATITYNGEYAGHKTVQNNGGFYSFENAPAEGDFADAGISEEIPHKVSVSDHKVSIVAGYPTDNSMYLIRCKKDNAYARYHSGSVLDGTNMLTYQSNGDCVYESLFYIVEGEGDYAGYHTIRSVAAPAMYAYNLGTGNNDSKVAMKEAPAEGGLTSAYYWKITGFNQEGNITPYDGQKDAEGNVVEGNEAERYGWNKRGTSGNYGFIGYWKNSNTTADNTWTVLTVEEAFPIPEYTTDDRTLGLATYASVEKSLECLEYITTTNLKALKNAVYNDVVTPNKGEYYRLKNERSNKYMSGNANGISIATEVDAKAGIFYIDSDSTLLSYNSGKYLDTNERGYSAIGTKYAGIFENAYGGYIANTLTYKNHDVWTYGGADSGTGADRIDRSTNVDNNGYNWIFEAVTSLPVTITDAGYATFNAPVEVTIPEDANVKAHTVTINGEWATLNEIEGKVIPANTPVILNGAAGTYNLDITTTGAAAIEGNALSGTVAAEYAGDEVYVLADGVNGVGLYKTATPASFVLKSHAAYLPATALTAEQQQSVGFRFDFNTTAIEEVETENGVEEIYDLQGRRINEITQPGIYVVGGVKRVVK